MKVLAVVIRELAEVRIRGKMIRMMTMIRSRRKNIPMMTWMKSSSGKKAEWEKSRQREDDEAKKLSKMNAQEKAEYKQHQLEKEIQELKDERTLSNMRDEARKQLSEKGINISDRLLAFMVSKDAKETKEAVDSFAELFNAAVNEAVKGKARQSTPKEGGYIPGGKEKINIGKMAREVRIIK